MAQKTFACTACGQPIEVPDDFKSAVIDCPACKAPHSRHSEKAYVSARGTRIAASGAPLVAANMPAAPVAPPNVGQMGMAPPARTAPPSGMAPPPGMMPPPGMPPRPGMPPASPYPVGAFMGPPPAQKSNMNLMIGLSIGGAAVVGGALLVAMLLLAGQSGGSPTPTNTAGPVAGQSAAPAEIPTDWVKYASPQGHFRAEFPAQPEIETRDFESGLGKRTGTMTSSLVGGIDFWVYYWDLGLEHPSEYLIDLENATRLLAKDTKTYIVKQEAMKFQNNTGTYALLQRTVLGPKIHLASVRVGNRVFTLCADGVDRDATPYFRRFFDNFNFDEELNYQESLYFELPGTLPLQTRGAVSLRLRGSGGKSPYTWKAEGLPRGLAIRDKDKTSGELYGTPEDVGTFSASITLVDDFKHEFKSTVRIEITKSPDNAGTMQTTTITGRAGLPVSGKVLFKPAQTPESVNWQWDPAQLPKGIKIDVYTPDLVISGTPTQSGKFSVALTCNVKFKGLELALDTKGTLEFDLIDAWPDVTAHFGKSTLIILHNGTYSPDPWKYLLNELAKKCGKLAEADKINLWTLTGFGRSISTKGVPPQPKSAGESVAKLLNRDAEKPNQRGGAAHKDLAAVPSEDYAGYDKLILVTNLSSEDTKELAKFQAELERIAAVAGLNVELVVIAKEVPTALASWLAEKNIMLTHYVP